MDTANASTQTSEQSTRKGRPLLWAAVLLLIALLVPTTAAASGTARVEIHITPVGSECDLTSVLHRTVPTPRVLTGALEELLKGPTAEERAAGVTSYLFSAETAGMLRSVAIRDGVAHVDFHDLRPVIPKGPTSCGTTSLLNQLDTTATQFPTVHTARYSINGSEATFYNWLGQEVPGTSAVTATRGSLRNTATIRRARGASAELRRIRVGRHDGFDRVVFEFEGGLPAYAISYTAVARRDGSGQPIAVLGTTALQVDLQARSVDMESASFPKIFRPSGPLTPRFPTLRQVRYGGEFEAQTTFAVGLRARTGFRVLELKNPTRLAIDVAHGAKVRLLRRGSRGADVGDWQEQLNTVQFGPFAVSQRPPQGPLGVDGVFGARSDRATRTFQRAEGLHDDGVVGADTRAAMRRAIRRTAAIGV